MVLTNLQKQAPLLRSILRGKNYTHFLYVLIPKPLKRLYGPLRVSQGHVCLPFQAIANEQAQSMCAATGAFGLLQLTPRS